MAEAAAIAYVTKRAVNLIANALGDAYCSNWQSIGLGYDWSGITCRIGVKREDNEWYLGFHKNNDGGRYRCDGWTITKMASMVAKDMGADISAEAKELASGIVATLA